jgi:hypothetical protein
MRVEKKKVDKRRVLHLLFVCMLIVFTTQNCPVTESNW